MPDTNDYQKILDRLTGVKTLLDIGCGDGELDIFLAKEGGIKVTGLDISASGFDEVKKKALSSGVKNFVRCIQGKIENIENIFRNERFDAITFIYSLHHIPNPVEGLKKAKKVLKTGGWIFVIECIAKTKLECCSLRKKEVENFLNQAGFKNLQREMMGKNEIHEYVLFYGKD
jgi:ubiquinone/menaquinone biosynthesis C-methylase UbiE